MYRHNNCFSFCSHRSACNMLYDVCYLAGLWFAMLFCVVSLCHSVFVLLKTTLNYIIQSLCAVFALNHWIKDMPPIYVYSRDTYGYTEKYNNTVNCCLRIFRSGQAKKNTQHTSLIEGNIIFSQ